MDYIKINSEAWDKHVEAGYSCTVPVSSEVIEKAKNGE